MDLALAQKALALWSFLPESMTQRFRRLVAVENAPRMIVGRGVKGRWGPAKSCLAIAAGLR